MRRVLLWWQQRRRCEIVLLGLDNTGKTTLLRHILMGEKVSVMAPTLHPQCEIISGVHIDNGGFSSRPYGLNFKIWDLGGMKVHGNADSAMPPYHTLLR